MHVETITHPLGRHLVTCLRDEATPPALFRTVAAQLTTLLALQATRDLPLTARTIQTPLEPTEGETLAGPLVAVPILRAGLGMLGEVLDLFPDVAVGYIGLERDEITAEASAYYCKLPPVVGRTVLLLDPMLATGGSVCQAIERLKAAGATDIRLMCVVAAPDGVARVNAAYPEVRIVAAALDRGLDPRKYIVPGLGDFGDRLYGTP